MPVRALSEPLPCEELSVVSCRIFCSDPMACAPNCGVEFFVGAAWKFVEKAITFVIGLHSKVYGNFVLECLFSLLR